MSHRSKSILLTGYKLGDPKKTGGFIVYTQNILKDLNELGIEYELLNTNTQFYKNVPHMFIAVVIEFFKKFRKYDHIFLQATTNHLPILGSIFIFFGKMFGKTISVKKTAGRFHREYENFDPIRRWLTRYVLKNADLVFFETKYLVEYFKHFNKKTYWHPNIRRNPNYEYRPKKYKKRFAFISLVAVSKGIDELLEVSNMLDDSYTVDIYGKTLESKYIKEYFEKYKANYLGALSSEEVQQKLKEYDVVVLPSHEEGYPGIFIEAYSFGVPVLTTTLPPIMEIVEDHKNGILVEPKNVQSLYQGFLAFNQDNYKQMSKNAYDSFEEFDSLKQTKKIIELIDSLDR
jgi:glycosyltransferase involved in cell wall biosynthesis